MIDFHCHIDLYADPAAVAADIRILGIYSLSVTTTPSAWSGTQRLSIANPWIRTSLGFHPELARERKRELALFDRLLPDVEYVGEVGLDGSQQNMGFWQEQLEVFRHILDSCQRAGGRILSIHSRHASKAVLACLDDYPAVGIPVLHWFSGSPGDLDNAIERGCWFSVSPAMMRYAKGRALIARMPPAQVLIESDGPFTQLSGRQIHPKDMMNAVYDLQSLWGITIEDTRSILRSNLDKVWK